MQNFIWPALLTIGAGVSVLIQQALNANLRVELNSAAWSGFMSYFLGVLCMVALAIVLRDPMPSTMTIARVPPWASDFHRPVDHHDSKARRGGLHCNLGDGPDGRRARRRSLWMAWRSRASYGLAARVRRSLVSRRRDSDTALITEVGGFFPLNQFNAFGAY